MAARSYLLFLLMLLVLAANSCAVQVQPSNMEVPSLAPVLELQDQLSYRSIGKFAEVYEDASRVLDFEAVSSHSQGWVQSKKDILSFGFSHSAYWLRFKLHNPSTQPIHKTLEIASPLQDYIDYYLVSAQGEILSRCITGDRRPFQNRPVDYRMPLFPLLIAPGQSIEIYLRLDTFDGLFEVTPINLWQEADFTAHVSDDAVMLGAYYGMLLALAIYNLFLLFSTRDRSYAFYAGYVGAFCLWNWIFRGYGLQYFWPNDPDWNNQMIALTSMGSHFMLQLFTIDYLKFSERLSKPGYRFFQFVACLSALCLIPPLLGYYALAFLLAIPVGLVAIAAGLSVGVVLSFRGFRAAAYFLLAFGVLATGVVLYYLRLMSVLPATPITENMLQIGSALEVLLLAFGISDQMNQLKLEKLAAEQNVRVAQTELANELEQQVRQRTSELEQVNQRLAKLAITDELTGAFNRRHFNEVFFTEVRRRRSNDQCIALCILDVDHFKNYNDRYGHQKGDEVLHAIATLLKSKLRRHGDKLFRLGGEEFGIVMNVEHADTAIEFIQQLRTAIETLHIVHEGSAAGKVTASFGLLIMSGEVIMNEPKDLYAKADALLYQAKASGRNRIEARAL